MKNILPLCKSGLMIAFVIAAISSCKKTDGINVHEPDACFSITRSDPFDNHTWPDDEPYQDFYYYFRNCSVWADQMAMHWDFGDGTISSELHPKHIYATRGVYNVSLTVTNQNNVQDTETQTIKVVSGQRNIDLGDYINLEPIAIEETPANDFLVLAKEWNTSNSYFFLLDSLLRQKSMLAFPSGYLFNSMKATTDGNYILTGSTQEINKANEIVKIKPDGSLVWNKKLHQDDTYTYVSPAPGSGYFTVGTRFNKTIVIKTDDTGTELWQKIFSGENMQLTNNAVIENDGIVVAGIKPPNGLCSNCDSIFVAKLDNYGNTVWTNVMPLSLTNYNLWDCRIARLNNGNYIVTNRSLNVLFFISNSGQFIDRKLAPFQVCSVLPTPDGNFVNLMTSYDNGPAIHMNKMTPAGVQLWGSFADGRQKIPQGISCCSVSRPFAITSLRKGGTVSAGFRVINNTGNSYTHQVIVLVPLDDAGMPK